MKQHHKANKKHPDSSSAEVSCGNTLAPQQFKLEANPIQMRPIYRGMIEDAGKPALGETARSLGVRVDGKNRDLTVENGVAIHNHQGMSTSPDSPTNLPPHRRPAEWGGEGRDPVWEAQDSDINSDKLEWFEDNPGQHGVVRPSQDMPYSEFKAALEGTQNKWVKAEKEGKQ